MKDIVLAAAIALCVGSNQIDVPTHSDRVAVAGCCKMRSGGGWTKVGLTFQECLRKNATEDGDDVYSQHGKIWWDLRC
jgi:hypothetical protein